MSCYGLSINVSPASSVKHWFLILGGCGNVRRWGKTLRTCFRRWDVAPSPCLFPVHHEENPSSFLFTMKRTLQASCSQQRELWMHLSITMMLSFQVLWMNKTRNSDQKHPSSLILTCRVLSGITQRESLTNILPYTSFPAPSLGFSIGNNEPFQLSSLSFTFYHFLPPSYLSTVPVFHSPPPPLFLIIF